MYSPSHSPSQQEEEEDEESLKLHAAEDKSPQGPEGPIHQNPHDTSMSASSSTPFPPPPVSIDYPPPFTDTHVSNHPGPPLTSPSGAAPLEGRFYSKRKKGKPNLKKQQSIRRKCETLMAELNPIPFDPPKILDFAKHEGLLKRLGLWDFVHIEFDASVRVDLIAQLVASYDPKARCSYVNGTRIAVNRADLARAFKLPVKKGASNVVGDGVVLDLKELTEEEEKDSIAFIEDFLSNWVLLHEDTWMMPTEVLNWSRMIKDGYLEKLDWAGLLWFMVEKELMQGEQLRDCYYASHLQHLIKSQHEELFSLGETEKVEIDVEAKEDECGGNKDDIKLGAVSLVQEEEGVSVEGPNIELSLGQDGREKGEVRDGEMMDVEEGNEDEENEEQGLLDVNNKVGDHFLQQCSMDQSRGLDNNEENIEEGEEIEEEKGDEAEDGFDVVPNHEASEVDGLTGNLLQSLDQMEFTSQQKFDDHSSMELLASRSDLQHANLASQSYYGNGGKRVLGQEDNMVLESLNGSNKRLKIDGQWDGKPSDFGSCLEQIQQLTARARMMYEEKEHSEAQLKVHQQVLFNEMQKRDAMIDHLHKSTCEEIQKRDGEILRLERELYVMGNLVEGYKRALKGIQKAFVEYRQRFQLPEEPIYRDAGPGGIMLSAAEIDRQRLEREEEHRLNCLMLEQKAKEAGEEYVSQFEAYCEKVHMLDEKLQSHENKVKQLKELFDNRKVAKSKQLATEIPERAQQVTEKREQQVTENPEFEQQVTENLEFEQQVTENPECEQQITENQEVEQQATENPELEQQVTENPELEQQVAENPPERGQQIKENPELEQQVAENPPEREQQVRENPEPEQQVTENPEPERQVTENPERGQQVTENPERGQQVTENPEREQQVTENPEREQHVTENPEREQHVTENPEREQQVTENSEREQQVTENSERSANA